MRFTQSTYHSKVYKDFLNINTDEYRAIIRYFEEFEKEIFHLELKEYIELKSKYCNALFEIGSYRSYLKLVEEVIALTIENNIQYIKGEDVYQELLFKKAAAYYNIHEYEKAKYILRELIKIDPWNPSAVSFLKKCIRSEKPAYIINIRAIGVGLFLLSAIIIAIELIIIRPYFMEYVDGFEMTRNIIFLLASLCLIGAETYYYRNIYMQTESFARKARSNKLKKALSDMEKAKWN